MTQRTGRRRLLGSLTVGAAATAVAGPALARETKKTGADETVTPPEKLMRDNAVLERLVLVYEAGSRRLQQGEDIDPAILVQAATLVRTFVHDHHEKVEEELVFPRFIDGGRMVDLVKVLIVQHAAARKLTERILAAAPQVRTREPRQAMAQDIVAFATLYRPHAAREGTDIYPTLRHLVTPADYAAIAEEMLKREREAFGADGFESVAKKVADVEKALGTNDLDLFTPKG